MEKLEFGKYLVGPEPTGCFNSGIAPALGRSKLLKKNGEAEYYVCREGDVCDIPKFVVYGKRNMFGRAPENFNLYRSFPEAEKQFKKLVRQILDANRETAQMVKELKDKMKSGDINEQIAAALQLSDITG